MLKKLTLEQIKYEFESKGFTLLTKVYKNTRQSFEYICPNNHSGRMRIDHLRNGVGCPSCSGNKRLTLDIVKESFCKDGYKLISNTYVNSKTKLTYICPKGHTGSTNWNNWNQGFRCLKCSGKNKPSFNKVIKSFFDAGYVLLSKEYINKNIKLTCVCTRGHLYKVSWENWFRNNSRCSTCYIESLQPKISDIKNSFNEFNYILLSSTYVNARTKLKCVCPEGHKYHTLWNNWVVGYRCPVCKTINNSGKNHYNWKGGISFEPYCEIWKDKQYKQDIKDRDNNSCLNPYCSNTDVNLVVHHIDYNKKNCKPNNLITLCNTCNLKANKDRSWHKAWYQAVIKNRYQVKVK